jgi:competence protein ComEC
MRTWLLQHKHVSWHIAAASAGVVAGVAAAAFVSPLLFAGWEWLVVALALFAVTLIKRTRLAFMLALHGGVLLGLWVGSLKQLQLLRYEAYVGQAVTVQGRVTDDTAYGPEGDQRLRLGDVQVNGRAMDGQIWVSTRSDLALKRGDRVTVQGDLSEGFGNVSASLFRAQLVDAERPQPGDVARQARDWFAAGVREAVPEPQASLGVSYLVGQRKALPDTLADEFRMLGLIHLVVASGFHLTIAARFVRRALMRVSKFAATAVTFMVIGGFLLLTGFSTSMSRAALVAGLSLLAWYYGRTVHPAVLLLLAAAITLLIDPSFLWGDIGWYLSFAAFAGVIMLAPLIHHYFWGDDKEPGAVRYIFVATVSAQITTFPIIALAFNQYSPLAILANLLIQPLVPVAMGLTLVSGLAGVLVPGIADIVGVPAHLVLSYMTSTVSWLSANPLAYGEIVLNAAAVAVMYAAVLLAMVYLWRRTGHRFRRDSLIE